MNAVVDPGVAGTHRAEPSSGPPVGEWPRQTVALTTKPLSTRTGTPAGTRPDPSTGLCLAPRYTAPEDADLPHVVKFSGGRSSAALALSLARGGALHAERGDVVLFANTTAEHPETYVFAARVCDEVEALSGVPCLWYEFCSYETATRNGWARRPGYRLVRRRPAHPSDTADKPGYRCDGSAFEALASLRAMLPNRSLRFCTQALKIQPGIALLAEWFAGGPGPRHLGHHHPAPQTSAQQVSGRYSGKTMTETEYETILSYAYSQPWARPQQRWADFTQVELRRFSELREGVDLAGRHGPPFRYLTLLGLRADEASRVTTATFRAMLADGATSSRCRHNSHPAGERISCPLYDAEITKAQVDAFWQQQPYDLGIDGRWGNCVYCPLKGEPALRRLAAEETALNNTDPTRPGSIRWWADIERRYGRASTSGDVDRFRFLSLRAPTYSEIADNPTARRHGRSQALPCACTD